MSISVLKWEMLILIAVALVSAANHLNLCWWSLPDKNDIICKEKKCDPEAANAETLCQ